MPNSLDLDFGPGEDAVQADDGLVEVTWPVIQIDEIENMPNYETVSINGKNFQIMRGEDVAVPPAVVEVLKNAVGTRYVKKDHGDGKMRNTPQEYHTIPWRQVGTQKMRVLPDVAKQGY